MKPLHTRVFAGLCTTLLSIIFTGAAFADAPIVTTVPGDANNPTIRHPVIAGTPVTLKGAVDEATAALGMAATWSWDPGDGGAAYTGDFNAVAVYWAVWAEHTYAGNPGDFFTATLTVDNGTDPAESTTFPIVLRADTVPNRANAAIAEALWYMHRVQRRFNGDEIAVEGLAGSSFAMGSWNYPATSGQITVSVQAATLNAFEANGHRENGDASNPYTDTVSRGMQYLFARLGTDNLVPQTVGSLDANPRNDNPDSNGNGLGVSLDGRTLVGIRSHDEPYELGMVMDAIVASGTPGTAAVTGPVDVIGRSYSDIVQDMVDWYAMAQSDSVSHGGWQYGPFNNSGGSQDNSASGWAATGVVAAEDLFGATVPAWLKVRNQNGLEFTDNESDVGDADGLHGYNGTGAIWGAYGTSGAAMVQMSMDAVEATTSPTPDERWIRTENFFRRHFDDAASGNNFKNYYYGMFNFTKAMRTAKPAAVSIIGTQVGAAEGGVGCGPSAGCAANGPQPLDWYNSAAGLAQTIIDYQASTGANIGLFSDRPGNSHGSNQDDHNQPWATQILTRTLAQAGPIAVGAVSPNPTGENFPVTLDHSRSFHQDPNRSLVLFEWDIDNDGTYDISSALANPMPPLSVPGGYDCVAAGGFPCSHTLNLRVTDNANPPVTTTDVIILDLTIPPHAPTALAGGPYSVCVNDTLTVDGSASFDIDEGQSEAGAPDVDTITAYEWELDGLTPFDYAEATGVSADWTFMSVGVADIGLRVTDNSSLSYPSASLVDLTDTDNTFVVVANCISADLAVTAIADNANPIIPDTVTVTVTVSNGGPDDATDVIVVGNLANLVTINSITPSQGSCVATGVQTPTQDQYRCDVGDLPAGGSMDIVVEIFGDTEGTAEFEFTVDVDGGQLLQLSDPNPNNNTIVAIVVLIDEIVIVVAGKGKGNGAFGWVEMLAFGTLVLGFAIMRRRRARTSSTASVAALCLVAFMLTSSPVEAQQHKGFYVGGAIGSATSDITASDFEAGLGAAGFTVSQVTLDDSATGWKAYLGYMFNDYVGVQASYVDLGELKSEFTASVPPDQIDALLAVGADLLPGRGKGVLADLVLQYPFSERWAVYGTLGVFFVEPESNQTVITGGSGTASQSESDNDFAGSIGINFQASERFSIKVGYERYDIDGNSTDFPMAAFSYSFGSK